MNQNQIIVELKRRGKEAEDNNMASKLSLLAERIIETASEHQKRVVQVMPEFDLHDDSHLAKVLDNMACLLVEKRIK